MSETDSPPPRRPASTRPRSDVDEHADAAPPTHDELDRMERHHAALTAQAGALVTDDAELGVTWVSAPGRGPGLNHAACIRWPAADAAERLELVERRMRESGEWPVLKLAERLTVPDDLAHRLAAAGWTGIGSELLMWTRHPASVPHLDPGLRVEAVTAASAEECIRLETANFELPVDREPERAARLTEMIEAGRIRAFLVRLAYEPVASARMDSRDGLAALSGVGVAAHQRRHGYGRMVAAVATRAGLATGHSLVWLSVVENNTPAVELYRSMGFAPAFRWSRWAAPSD